MDWQTAGEASVVACEVLAAGEAATPDIGSLTVTLRGHDGTIMTGYDNLALNDVLSPLVTFPIPAEVNTPADPTGLVETRYVQFSYTVSGIPYKHQLRYRLTAFLPIQKTAQNVRDLLGAAESELPDSAIDLVEAYFKLVDDVGVKFSTATMATTRANICANNMIALQAAIDVLPTMQTRLLKLEKSHDESFQRSSMDFQKLEGDLRAKLSAETTSMVTSIDGAATLEAAPILFLTTNPTDVITGV